MKVYVAICKEIEIPDKFEDLIGCEDEEFDYDLHAELCKYIPQAVGLPLAGNTDPSAKEWIESVMDEHWRVIVES